MTEVDWPIPPAAIRYRVVSPEQHSEQAFLELSQAVALSIEEGLRAVGRKIHDFKTVLDWGAGCGRVLRYWRPLLNRIGFCGSDVARDAIEWDQANLPGVEWRLNDPLPPLTWLDDTFDFIFGVSV